MKIQDVLFLVEMNIEAEKEGRNGIKTSTLSGEPGIGKTERLSQLAQKLNMSFYHVSAPEMSIEQLTGLPEFENVPEGHHVYSVSKHKNPKGTAWSCPEIIATANTFARDETKDGCILLLDDLHETPMATLSYFYQLLNEKKVSGWALDERVHIVCAMNNSSSANFEGLPSPIINRMAIYDVKFDADEFLAGYAVRFNYLVRSFLAAKKEYLTEKESTVRAYGTPRSWTLFNNSFEYWLGKNRKFVMENLREITGGSVSDKAALDFQTHVVQIEKMNLNKYVENKTMVDVSKMNNLEKVMIGYIVNFIHTVEDAEYLHKILELNIEQKSFTGFCASEIYLKFKHSKDTGDKLPAGLILFLKKGLGIGEFKIEELGELTPNEIEIVEKFEVKNREEFYTAVLPYI